ncbi:MAG: hypothetical protein U0354_15330 [Candidatus Sericytochromatia bacterium]
MSNLNNLKINFKDLDKNDVRAEILVDEKPIIDSNYILDLDELEKSIDYHGKFFILTFESDNPNLINLSQGIEIKKDESENVEWNLSSDNKKYLFDGDDYRKSILEAVNNWKKIVSEKEENEKLSYQDIHTYIKYSELDDED